MKIRKTLSVFLAIALCISLLAGEMAIRGFAAVTGSGTEEDPYILTSSSDLSKMKNSSSYFKLGADIYCSSWTIADFSGVLDGNGHTLTLYSNKKNSTSSIALFDENKGTIRNLNLKCSLYHHFYEPTSSGKLAGICIDNSGTIENCTITGSIESVLFDTSYMSVDVAGICVNNDGTIKGCAVYADIRSNCNSVYCSDELAGICVTNGKTGIITQCVVKNYMNADDYGAGIARVNYGKISECCVASSLFTTSSGFAGNSAPYGSSVTGTVENCISFSDQYRGTAVTKGCTNCITAGSFDYDGTAIDENAVNSYDIGDLKLTSSGHGLVVTKTFSESDFPGFDFDKIWYITDYGVPYLRSLNMPKPQSVTFDGPEELSVGGTATIDLEVLPQNAVLYSLSSSLSEGEHETSWSTYYDDIQINITPASVGQTRLVISDSAAGVIGFKNYEITQGVESIVISGPNRVGVGQSIQLTAEVSPADAKNTNVIWGMSSLYGNRVSISSTGKVTGNYVGQARVYAESEDGNVTVWYDIMVAQMPSSITISEESLTLYPDETQMLTAAVSPSDAEDTSYTWESSDERVATVSSDGKVTAKGYGTATIKATCNDGGVYDECTVTVVKKPESVKLTGPSVIGAGEEVTYQLQVTPGDAVVRVTTWEGYDSSIISVEKIDETTVKITGLSGGETMLSVMVDDLYLFDTVELEVVRHPESVIIDRDEIYLAAGDREQLSATVLPEDTTNKNVTWQSDNSEVASVSSTGRVTARKVGTAVITCTTEDGEKTDQITVHVQIPAESMTLETTDITMCVDESYQIKATILPENATYKNVVLNANNSLLEVDQQSQTILAKGVGTVVLQVSTPDGKLKETVYVTILAANHVYADPVFIWTSDYSGCEASRSCVNGCTHVQTSVCTIDEKIVEASCSETGTATYTATAVFDGKTYQDKKTVELPVLDHVEVTDAAEEATCTETGLTEGKHCSVCGAVTKAQETVPAKGHKWADATCTAPKTCSICGATEGRLGHTYANDQDADCDRCGEKREVKPTPDPEQQIKTTPMYRLYNPYSGEHFYTGSLEERDMLVTAGWIYEGVAWNAPISTGDPVYRLYNPYSGDHHYTMSIEEKDMLVTAGWKYEGVAWNSATPDNLPLYRLYNPNADCGSHHYTGSTEERDFLVGVGWIYEGIGWFGMLK